MNEVTIRNGNEATMWIAVFLNAVTIRSSCSIFWKLAVPLQDGVDASPFQSMKAITNIAINGPMVKNRYHTTEGTASSNRPRSRRGPRPRGDGRVPPGTGGAVRVA